MHRNDAHRGSPIERALDYITASDHLYQGQTPIAVEDQEFIVCDNATSPRWRLSFALLGCLAVVGCKKPPPKDPLDPQLEQPVANGTSSEPTVNPIGGPDHIVIDVAGQPVTVTLQDGAEVKAALLKRIEASRVEHRDHLLESTKLAPVWIDDKALRIGGWLLHADNEQLVLRYRLPHGKEGALSYLAPVVRAGEAWSVKELRTEIMHARR